ncbi:MAG: ABC transporter permease [bacterium]|nr:ABC transporter permease [bacterium]
MTQNYIIKMAFRNISRNRRRTLLSIVAIGMAVFFTCFMKSYITGLWSNVKGNTFIFETGHIKVLNRDYLKEEKLMPLDLNIDGYGKDYTEVIGLIKNVKGVKQIFPRTRFGAIINRENGMKNVMGFAFAPALEKPVNSLEAKIVEGRMFREYSPGQHEMVMGRAMAAELGVKTGDKITLMTKTAEEGLGHMTFRITGLSSYGVAVIDKSFFFISLSTAARFLKMENSVMELVIFLDDDTKSRAVTAEINRILNSRPGNPYQAYSWEEQGNGQYYEMFVKMSGIYNVIFVIFLVLASLVIVNTVMMVIYERMKEIGTIAAMGMRGSAIVRLFFFEAVIVSIISSFSGTVLGGIVSYIASRLGINVGKLTGGGMSIRFSEIIYPYIGWDLLLFSFVFGVVVASVCSYIPALRAARIEPVEALKGVY